MPPTVTSEFTASVIGIGQVEIDPMPADPSIPGQRFRVSATSNVSAADAKSILKAFLQSLRDAAQ